jgi:type II secretory pathway component PulF
VTELDDVAAAAPVEEEASGRRRRQSRRQRLRDLSMFTRQLHVLVLSGTQLVQALAALRRQIKPGPLRDIIGQIRKEVEEGTPLAEAMSAHPEYFDKVYCSLVTVGESSGNLSTMLERLTRLTQKRIHVRNCIMGALMYPSLLVVAAVIVLGILLVFVIPRFAMLFESMDVPLPTSTQTIIAVSDTLRVYWWAILILIVAAVAGLRYYSRSPGGKRTMDTLALKVPRFGGIVQSFATARITRLLGLLLDSQVPVLEALKLTRAGTTNVHYAELVAKAEEAVVKGEPISSAFRQSPLISPSICEAISSGEQSGQVGTLLLNIADFMDEENEVIVQALTSIIEPVILILLGVLVAFVAMSMFMPLFDLTAMTGG